jgi:hypothetical protein
LNSLSQHISEFLNSEPENKVVFCNHAKDAIDMGKELSSRIKPNLEHKRLSMKTKDLIDELMHVSIQHNDKIGKHITIKNLGILFEPELKINFKHFLKTYSTDFTLIIEWSGEISNEHLFFLSKMKGFRTDLKNLTYTNYEV